MAEAHDGRFDLYYHDGWAYLVVYPPEGSGREVYHDDVVNRMRILGMPRVDGETIRGIVTEATGIPARIVEWPEGAKLASTVTFTMSDDAMAVDATITAPRKGAAPMAVQAVVAELGRAGVRCGIDHDAIRTLLSSRQYDQRVRVATGTPPVDAESARIVYHFNPDRGRPFLTNEFDQIDLRELNFIENVEKDALLAEVAPGVPPRDGKTVTGERVPARTDTVAVALRGGAKTELRDGGRALYATDTGNACVRDGVIVVEPVVTVKDVDYHTGNVRIDGSVVVERGIADGFVVEATGDVQVGQGVGRATIRAGGNVLLKTGINGGTEGIVEADGNVFARYIESATVSAAGHVLVEEAIMHSSVAARGNCVLNGRRSEIIASRLVVGGSVWCKKLGSIAEALVSVEIGVAPDIVDGFRAATAEYEQAQDRRDTCRRQLEQIVHAAAQHPDDERIAAARRKLEVDLAELGDRIPTLRQRIGELRDRLDASRTSFLVAEQMIYSGARVLFGLLEYHAPERGASKTILRAGPAGLIDEGFSRATAPKLVFPGKP